MKRKLIVWTGLLLALLMCMALLGCSRHRITVISGEKFVHKYPKTARTGETVTVETSVVSDAELYVNGVDGTFIWPGEYQFVMPDTDVELKVTVIANPNGA